MSSSDQTGVLGGRTAVHGEWKILQWVIWRVSSGGANPEYWVQGGGWTTSHADCFKAPNKIECDTYARQYVGDVKGPEPWVSVRHNWTS